MNLNFSELSDQEKIKFAELMFKPLSSPEEVKHWVRFYLDLEIPLEIVDPDSTSSPLDAIWQVYNTFKTNTGYKNPGYILMSCREGMKCQKKGTILITYNGFKKIEDVKVGDIIWTGFSWQKVTATFDEGMKPSVIVNLEGGHESTGTPIHRYWALRDGKEQWIAGKDLNPNTDLLCLNVNTDFKNYKKIDKEKYEIGYFLGLLIGDGGLTQLNKLNRFSLTIQDTYIKDFFYYFSQKYFKCNIYNYKLDYRISNKNASKKIRDWGLTNSYSWEKVIPSFAWSHIDAMKGFIAGVFDTDGCWDKKGDCFFEMTGGPLLDQIQIALTALGIESKVRHNTKMYVLQKHLLSRLTIGQTEAGKFEKLGIIFKAKKAQKHKINKIPNCKDTLPLNQVQELIDLANNKTDRSIRNRKHRKPRIRNYPAITVDKLGKLINWLNEGIEHNLLSKKEIDLVKRYEKILANKWKKFTVKEDGKQYFYDLTVENEHSYWSNGLISHNTVSVAILETLLLLHFQLDIGHASATEDQSAVALGYIESFLLKVEPLSTAGGWTNMTQNKRLFKFKTPQGKQPYIKIVICSTKGMNSLHSNVLFLDELDLADPKALKEGKNITGYSKGIYGVTVYLSTRKYAFGNMTQAIDNAAETNYKILNWNIIDVTEQCPPERHLPDQPKLDLYVNKSLPLQTITVEQFENVAAVDKPKWEVIKDAHAGCAGCKLLPVCKTRLSRKSPESTGGFHKPIISVIQKFVENDPDTAEAQLMCFSGNTQILMGDGTSKNISEIKIGDKIISHLGKVQAVTKLFKRLYSGEVYIVNNNNWKHFEESYVTTEHPYFVNGNEFKSISNVKSFEFGKDGSLKKNGDYFSLPNGHIGHLNNLNYSSIVNKPINKKENKIKLSLSRSGRYISENFELNENFGWILGYFLSEGFFLKKEGRPIGITFCSDKKENEYHEKVRNFAKSLGLTTSEFSNKTDHGYTIDIYNSALAELFLELCGQYSDGKKINSVLMDSNLNFLSEILEGFYCGDGTKRKNSYKELTTTSYQLASQLFLIAAKLGLCPRLTKKPPINDRKQAYLVHYINKDYVNKQKRTKFLPSENYNLYRVDSMVKSFYEGNVYNFEVEEDHSYIANGVAVHNCWKPGSTGLVYPRFNPKNNVVSLKEAYEEIFGPTNKVITELTLIYEMQQAGILFYAGVDWGYTHDFVITVVASIPNGDVYLMDTYAQPGLEFSDQLEIAKTYRDKYGIHKWFADTAMPSSIKSFNKNGMKCAEFKKDVLGGIEAVRSKIISTDGKRRLKFLNTEANKKAITAITKHRFVLDGQGNPTLVPDDSRGIADICDTFRYIGQNLFPVRGTQKPQSTMMDASTGKPLDSNDPEARKRAELASQHETQMKEELARLSGETPSSSVGSKKGSFHWSF